MSQNDKQKKINTTSIVFVAVMAALSFIGCQLRITIPLPIGKTMIHFGNIFCLMAGLLLGGVRGGLAGGIGMAIFDLTSEYTIYAPGTFIIKFLTGFVCGSIARSRGHDGSDQKRNALAAILGISVNVILSPVNSMLIAFFSGSAIEPLIIATLADLGTSLINGILAVVCALLLTKLLRTALDRAGLLKKL